MRGRGKTAGRETTLLTQAGRMDPEEILSHPAGTAVGLLWTDNAHDHRGARCVPLRGVTCADQSAHQGARGSQPVRPSLGGLRRGTPRRQTGADLLRTTETSAAVERAERPMPRLPPQDHHAHGVAQPPCGVAVPWRERWHSESGARASHLPQPSASPRAHRRETASGSGRLRGLSCLTGNCHEQFLGGGMAATPSCYPAPTSRWRGGGATCIGPLTLRATW